MFEDDYFELNCPNAKLVGEKVDCQLKLYSEKPSITFQIDYGNKFVETFSLASKIDNFFY